MDPLGPVHHNLHGMNLNMLCVVLTPETLQLLKGFLRIASRHGHIAAVNINRQFSLLIQFAQTLVYLLMEHRISRQPGIKYAAYAGIYRKLDPAVKRSVNLPVGQFHHAVQNDGNFRRGLNHISGHMTILPDIISKSRHRIRRVVSNTVFSKDPGVYPDAVSFRFLN